MQVFMGSLHTSAMLMLTFTLAISQSFISTMHKRQHVYEDNGHKCKLKVSVYEQHLSAAWIVKWPLKRMLEIVDVEIK